MEIIQNLSQVIETLPPEWPISLQGENQSQIINSGYKIVILDDDPTGTQTVFGTSVITEWTLDTLEKMFLREQPGFFILTNTRSLPASEAIEINLEIGTRLNQASKLTGVEFRVISRSDSTLRGHFPEEIIALTTTLQKDIDGCLIIPSFIEGGRYTINDIHYIHDGNNLIPSSQTPFAKDNVFGYTSSNLKNWVEEKSKGLINSAEVISINISDIRMGGPEKITQKLLELASGKYCIVNALTYQDLDVFTTGLINAENKGKYYLYRTAASFVRSRLGLTSNKLLTKNELNLQYSNAGVIIVGSHVPLTTRQLENLLTDNQVTGIEVQVSSLIDTSKKLSEIQRVAEAANLSLSLEKDVVIYTSRKLVFGKGAGQNLSIGKIVSSGLVEIAQQIEVRPKYILAKGGITSSDIAVKALQVREALVLGQILPGVSVWELQQESRFPGVPYIIFPGNVGEENDLLRLVTVLR